MKKGIFLISSLILIILIGFIIYINGMPYLKFEQSAEKLLVRNGSNGKTVEITDNEEIKTIIDEINSLNLKKQHKIPDYTGWEIILDIYYRNKEKLVSLVIRHNKIEYNGYYYGENN